MASGGAQARVGRQWVAEPPRVELVLPSCVRLPAPDEGNVERKGTNWVRSVRSIWRNQTNPHLGGIFPSGSIPTHMNFKPNKGPSGSDPSQPSSTLKPNT